MRLGGALGIGVLALLALAPLAPAATYEPNKLGDHAPNGCSARDCTLREAVIKANAHGGADTIVLRGGKTYRRGGAASNEDASLDGDLDVTDPLKIRSSTRRLAKIDARGNERVLHAMGRTSLVRLKLTKGDTSTLSGPDADGGAIYAETVTTPFTLKVTRSVVSRSESVRYGGGIGGNSTLVVKRSRMTGNEAQFAGGGIIGFADVRIANSTVSGNRSTHSSGNGGGITMTNGVLTVKGTTISGNTAGARGGGFWNDSGDGVARLTNTTITNNRTLTNEGGGIGVGSSGGTSLNAVTIARNEAGDYGGGIAGFNAITVRNSLIALNTAGGLGPDCGGIVTSGGYNLVGDAANCTGFGTTGDRTGLTPAQVKLRPLAANGGPTKTIAVRRGSEAINHAGPSSPGRDQRGVRRRNPDIGAFERTPRD